MPNMTMNYGRFQLKSKGKHININECTEVTYIDKGIEYILRYSSLKKALAAIKCSKNTAINLLDFKEQKIYKGVDLQRVLKS